VGILLEEEVDTDLLLLALERDVLFNNSFFAAEPVLQRSMDLASLRCAVILEDLWRAACSLACGSRAWGGGGWGWDGMYGESLIMRRGWEAGRQCIPSFTLLFSPR
jgi:hypothetical protein